MAGIEIGGGPPATSGTSPVRQLHRVSFVSHITHVSHRAVMRRGKEFAPKEFAPCFFHPPHIL